MAGDDGKVTMSDATRQIEPPQARHELPLETGARVGAYVIDQVIGVGGGGAVYLARHVDNGSPAAVKVLRREMAESVRMVQRFVREVQTLRMVSHPNVVEVFELGSLPDGRPFFAMEYLEGSDLRRHLETRGRMSPGEALELLTPVCAALDAAHGVGVVHRDLKASNIHLSVRNGVTCVKLLDFGIAKLLEPEPGQAGLTVAGTRLGTPQTMAPEQIRAETVSSATDVYALGVLLYQLLTGSYPFEGDNARDIERQHLTSPPPRPSASAPVPASVDAVVLRAMEKSADRRYASAGAFIAALREAAPVTSKMDGGRMGMGGMGSELARAVAVYLELRPADATRALDDAEMDQVLDCLDTAESTLSGAGFRLALQTSSAVLGVRVLEGDAEAAQVQARELADELRRKIGSRLDSAAGVLPRVVVRMDAAQVQQGAGGLEVTGGPITSIDEWAAEDDQEQTTVRRTAG